MSGADKPRGQNFDVNRNHLSLRSFATSVKQISFKSDFIPRLKNISLKSDFIVFIFFFHDFINENSPVAGADSPQGTKF